MSNVSMNIELDPYKDSTSNGMWTIKLRSNSDHLYMQVDLKIVVEEY